MKKDIPEDEKSCWNCSNRRYKSKEGSGDPYNYCRVFKTWFGPQEELDKKLCPGWE